MNILCVPYGSEHQQAVRVGDTLRILVSAPQDGNTWAGNVTIKETLSGSAVDDTALAEYTGEKVAGRQWSLSVDYDTSTIPLVANTRYVAIAEVTSGTKKREFHTVFNVLPQGR